MSRALLYCSTSQSLALQLYRISRVSPQAESLVIDGVSHGFKLKFFFDSNPYFTNEVGRCGPGIGRQGSAHVITCVTRAPTPPGPLPCCHEHIRGSDATLFRSALLSLPAASAAWRAAAALVCSSFPARAACLAADALRVVTMVVLPLLLLLRLCRCWRRRTTCCLRMTACWSGRRAPRSTGTQVGVADTNCKFVTGRGQPEAGGETGGGLLRRMKDTTRTWAK